MSRRKQGRRGISLGTIVMTVCTIAVLAGFAALMPSFTGNQDILIDAARLAVAMDDSLTQLTASTSQMLQNLPAPQQTIVPPFKSKTDLSDPSADGVTVPPSITAIPAPTESPIRSFTLCAAGSLEWNSDVRKALTINKETRFDLLTDQVQQAMEARPTSYPIATCPPVCWNPSVPWASTPSTPAMPTHFIWVTPG